MATTRWSRGRKGLFAVALAAVAVAVALVVVVIRGQVSAPDPVSAGRIDPAAPAPQPTRGSRHPDGPPPLGPSKPAFLTIPAIGVHTVVNALGLNADGSLAVPQPGPQLDQAAWFENSPTPGQPGPAVIEGHVDSVEGPSVFFKLGDVHPGDRILVHRADGRRLTFRVDAVRDFLKTSFPTRLVYGGRQLSEPTLRLITCSDFDAAIGHHVGNEVVFAHLVHSTNAS